MKIHCLSSRRTVAYLMLGLMSTSVVASASSPAPAPSSSAAIASIRAELQHRADAGQFSGAVLIAQSGTTLLESAYGLADREKHIANTPGTRFRFGSMGKMFTAVAIMQLVQAGKVRIDDTVGKFLPDYPNAGVAKVTIEQLLTHTGGTGDIFGPDFPRHRSELEELRDYVDLYGRRDVRFAPGTRHEYSNYGFILLGRVIEVASGTSYYDYLSHHVFEPAGMSSSGNLPEQPPIANLAVSYTRGAMRGPGPPPADAPLRRADEFLPYRGTSAGGGYSTVGDLGRFADALSAHRLLSASLTDTMTTGHVDTPFPGLRYAFGFEDATLGNGARRIGHGGGAPGMNGILWIYPRTHLVVAVLANVDPPAAQEAGRFIAERLAPQ